MKINKILLIDDSPIARIILKKCIPMEYETMEADSGEAGLDALNVFKPDLVFLDLTMPGMDGFETLERIKKLDADLPVVILSADRQKASVSRVLELGAWNSLKKPPSPAIIRQTIKDIAGSQ